MDTRSEHLARCKQRALRYVDEGDVTEAFNSMGSDLQKHPETANHSGVMIGIMMLMACELKKPDEMRRFIEGFN